MTNYKSYNSGLLEAACRYAESQDLFTYPSVPTTEEINWGILDLASILAEMSLGRTSDEVHVEVHLSSSDLIPGEDLIENDIVIREYGPDCIDTSSEGDRNVIHLRVNTFASIMDSISRKSDFGAIRDAVYREARSIALGLLYQYGEESNRLHAFGVDEAYAMVRALPDTLYPEEDHDEIDPDLCRYLIEIKAIMRGAVDMFLTSPQSSHDVASTIACASCLLIESFVRKFSEDKDVECTVLGFNAREILREHETERKGLIVDTEMKITYGDSLLSYSMTGTGGCRTYDEASQWCSWSGLDREMSEKIITRPCIDLAIDVLCDVSGDGRQESEAVLSSVLGALSASLDHVKDDVISVPPERKTTGKAKPKAAAKLPTPEEKRDKVDAKKEALSAFHAYLGLSGLQDNPNNVWNVSISNVNAAYDPKEDLYRIRYIGLLTIRVDPGVDGDGGMLAEEIESSVSTRVLAHRSDIKGEIISAGFIAAAEVVSHVASTMSRHHMITKSFAESVMEDSAKLPGAIQCDLKLHTVIQSRSHPDKMKVLVYGTPKFPPMPKRVLRARDRPHRLLAIDDYR